MSTDSNRILQAAITKYVRDKLERGYLESTPLMVKATESGRVTYNAGGIDLKWPIKKTRNPNWESFAPFDKVDFVATDALTMAELEYAAYRSNDFLPRKEELSNKGSMERIFDLERQKVDDLVNDAKIDLNVDMHSGTGANDKLVGIETAIPTSYSGASYGGIAFTGNTFWQNNITSGSGYLNNSFALDAEEVIENAMLGCTYDKETGGPDFGITTKTVFAKIGRIFSAKQRVVYAAERKLGGGPNLIVNGAEIMWDDRAAANVLRLINSKVMDMFFMTDGIFDVKRERGMSPSGVAFYLECFPMLRIRQPRYCSAVTNCNT